ncbi:MAG TPA: type II secretion system minor pseudopilin GspK [Gammaproteobacteria bacterium]|nr:type II secretion system minor pseudopilin GspK [Gammaproteobacteria bacterium]
MKNPIREQGAAIIVALFVTALVAAAALAMIEHLALDTRRTELIQNDNQANLYAAGSIAWAIEQLITDWKQQQPQKLIDRTPIISPPDEINHAKISSIIYDAEGNLNLNNLTDTSLQPVMVRLIQLAAPNVNASAAKNIVSALVDWITPGIHESSFDQYYEKLNPPYRAAHHPMASVSELRLVQGMTADLYEKLLPFVTALPDKTKLNINSIPIPVLMSFSPAITLETAKAFDLFRKQKPITNLDVLANFAAIKNSPVSSYLTLSSDFFLLTTHVTIETQTLTLNTLLMRTLKNNQPTVIILWQSKGTL